MNSRREFLAGGVSLLAAPLLAGCGGGSSNLTNAAPGRSIAFRWDDTALQAISAVKPGPPMVARSMGIVHTCMFDAWAAYDPVAVGTRSGGALRRPAAERTRSNKEKAISYAAYRALVDVLPTQKALFDSQMSALGFDPADVSTDTSTPAGIGNTCAAAILTFRHADGSNQLGDLHPGAYSDYTGYVPVNTPDNVVDPSQWQQLRFSNGASPGYIGPFWGRVTPFSLTSGAQFRPPPPPAFGSPAYRAEVQEIVDLTANLTDRQKVIAEYWADGPGSVLPPGHWCLFGQFVSTRDHHDLDTDVKMFFLVANAVMDAGIAVWESKRTYNTSRPITAIRYLYKGQTILSYAGQGKGIQPMDGADWSPYQAPTFITPPFPEYVSGHSAFSSAGAEVLKRFTGSDTFGASTTVFPRSGMLDDTVPGSVVELSWPTFSNAADEAGISRRYGGIHFLSGDLNARDLGRKVGEQVWNVGMSYINGTAQA